MEEGIEVCKRCNGTGKSKDKRYVCIKCFGAGKVAWLNNIIIKPIGYIIVDDWDNFNKEDNL
jgi:RecJ-like exonuclease